MEKRRAKTISVFDFMKRYADEAFAVKFVESQLWGEKPMCNFCSSVNTTPRPSRSGHRCNFCRKYFSVRISTIFERSRLLISK